MPIILDVGPEGGQIEIKVNVGKSGFGHSLGRRDVAMGTGHFDIHVGHDGKGYSQYAK